MNAAIWTFYIVSIIFAAAVIVLALCGNDLADLYMWLTS